MNIPNIKTIGHYGLQVKLPQKPANNSISLVQLFDTSLLMRYEKQKKIKFHSGQHDKLGQGIV